MTYIHKKSSKNKGKLQIFSLRQEPHWYDEKEENGKFFSAKSQQIANKIAAHSVISVLGFVGFILSFKK